MTSHNERLDREVEWYASEGQPEHFLNRWPLYSARRNESAFEVARSQLFRFAAERVPSPKNVLVAPCGICLDYPLVRATWPAAKIAGLDIVPNVAPEQTHVGDILRMPFADNEFDLAVCNLFFHHVADEGFAPYLQEVRRVAKRMITLEPSVFHPMFLVTRPAHKIFGMLTKQVPHEHPISLGELARACKLAGYRSVETFACSFPHNRTPVPLRAMINTVLHPLKKVGGVKHLAWLVGLVAQDAV